MYIRCCTSTEARDRLHAWPLGAYSTVRGADTKQVVMNTTSINR